MLDKLKLSKSLVILALVLLSSCTHGALYNTELYCPGNKILIRFARADEVRKGIERAMADKKKYGTSENYTVIRMPGNRSFKIEKIPPEDSMRCSMQEFQIEGTYKQYEKYYH
jgi:hypothetical protein